MIPSALFDPLHRAAHPSLVNALTYGGTRSVAPHGEVSAVRALTLDGFDQLAVAWSPILSSHGYRLELHAVFCHSRPHVEFDRVPSPWAPPAPDPGRCELADLLIVIDHVDPHTGRRDRRAALVQAKLTKGGKVRPSGREWLQHELLAWLPSFTFVDKGYDPRRRALNGSPLVGSPDMTAEYGGFDLSASPRSWNQLLPSQTRPRFRSGVPLARHLTAMATGGAQCGRDAEHNGSDDWSFTVDELLRVTAAKPIVQRRPSVLRGNTNVVGLLVDHSVTDGDDAIPPALDEEGWGDGPISTVRMTFRSLEDPETDLPYLDSYED